MSDPHELPPPAPAAPKRAGGRPFGWLLLYTRGLIVDQHLRRLTMFYVVITTMVMVFAGAVFVFDWKEHPLRFVVYWLAVISLTILVMLLTIYDLLLLRLQHRVLSRQLRERMLGRDLEAEIRGQESEAGSGEDDR